MCPVRNAMKNSEDDEHADHVKKRLELSEKLDDERRHWV